MVVERITYVQGGLARLGPELEAVAKQLGVLTTQYQGVRAGQVKTQH